MLVSSALFIFILLITYCQNRQSDTLALGLKRLKQITQFLTL